MFSFSSFSQTGGASDFIKSSDLGDYVDAIIGPAPSGVLKNLRIIVLYFAAVVSSVSRSKCDLAMLQLTEGGYKKRGSIAVSKIDASGFYYLNVEGEPGHAIKCILQASFD